jgi:hypothetical protein
MAKNLSQLLRSKLMKHLNENIKKFQRKRQNS